MLSKLIKINFKKLQNNQGGVCMETTSAREVALWLIKNNMDCRDCSFNGNMKLQKLLYFSQVVHLAKYGNPLFNDDMYAFEKGTVVENVRREYRNQFEKILLDSIKSDIIFSQPIKYTLEVVSDIFGNLSAQALSDVNHAQKSWEDAYYNSYTGSFHYKERSKISLDSIISNDIKKVKEMLSAYETSKKQKSEVVVINNIKFYYNPDEIDITDEITDFLENFEGEDSVYSLTCDDECGIVVY